MSDNNRVSLKQRIQGQLDQWAPLRHAMRRLAGAGLIEGEPIGLKIDCVPKRFIDEYEEYNPFSNKFPDEGQDDDLQEFRELESSTMQESVPDSTYQFLDDGFSEEDSEDFSEEDFDSYACPECGEDDEDCVCSIKECSECGEDVEDCVCSLS